MSYMPSSRDARRIPLEGVHGSVDLFRSPPGMGFAFLAALPVVTSIINSAQSLFTHGSSSNAGGVTNAQLDAAYARAVYGNAPADYQMMLNAANAGNAKAASAVNDLRARGWYGGQRSTPYSSWTPPNDTVNFGNSSSGDSSSVSAAVGNVIQAAGLTSGKGPLGIPMLAWLAIGGAGFYLFSKGGRRAFRRNPARRRHHRRRR